MRAHLESIALAHPNVHLHVFYSRPAREIDGADIHIGRIDLGAMQRLIPPKRYDFYICGPPAMRTPSLKASKPGVFRSTADTRRPSARHRLSKPFADPPLSPTAASM